MICLPSESNVKTVLLLEQETKLIKQGKQNEAKDKIKKEAKKARKHCMAL